MLSATYNFLTVFIAVLFSAVAIKLADDFLDRDVDYASGSLNWAEKLGSGTMLYAMLFIVVAAGINAGVSLSLFMSSYIVGMFSQLKHKFISGLTGIQESLLVLLIGILCCGWRIMLFALFFIFAIQLFDDCIDIYRDQLAGLQNWAKRLGITECLLAALLSLLMSWFLSEALFIPSLFAAIIVYLFILKQQKLAK